MPDTAADLTTSKATAESGAGISARDVTVTYRNGQTALWNASFQIPHPAGHRSGAESR